MKRWIVVSIIIVFSLIIMLPPIIHGYVYPTIGDDAASHLSTFQQMKQYGASQANYFGEIVAGYPLLWLDRWISIDTSYLWFNYIALLGVALSFYYITKKLVSEEAGIPALIIPVFAIGGILFQWYSGTIFNIINIAIMVWGTYHALRWLEYRKSWWRLGMVAWLFSVAWFFHPSGKYIIAIIPAIIVSHFISERIEIKYLTTISITCIALFVVSMTHLSPYPFRQTLDGITLVGLLFAGGIGVALVTKYRKVVAIVATIMVVGMSSIPVYHWLADYNSAVKPVDIKAIAYLNTLDGRYFSCSPEVAPWIYERFTDKTYQVNALPYVKRSTPMTQRTIEGSEWYWGIGVPQNPSPDYENMKVFFDSSMRSIEVYD